MYEKANKTYGLLKRINENYALVELISLDMSFLNQKKADTRGTVKQCIYKLESVEIINETVPSTVHVFVRSETEEWW